MALTQTQKDNYVKSGSNCPYCNSPEIQSHGQEFSGGNVIWQDISCDDCGEEWTEEFRLVGIEEIQK